MLSAVLLLSRERVSAGTRNMPVMYVPRSTSTIDEFWRSISDSQRKAEALSGTPATT